MEKMKEIHEIFSHHTLTYLKNYSWETVWTLNLIPIHTFQSSKYERDYIKYDKNWLY